MDASAAGSSATHSHGKQGGGGGGGGGRGKAPAAEIRGGAARGDDFLFAAADDTFPNLPDFPCLSSPSSSTFSSSSSSSNSSSAFTTAAGGGGGGVTGGEPSEPASAADGFDDLADIDQLLDLASLSVPWDVAEPLFPDDDVGMMMEDAISPQPPHHQVDGGGEDGAAEYCNTGDEKAVVESPVGGGDACMAAEEDQAPDDLPGFFMEWLTSNREYISADDLRSIRLRRSTIEAAAERLGGGRQGTMQLLKLILTWVQNHHLQNKKRPRTAMDEAAAAAASSEPSPGYEFPSSGAQEMASAAAGTSWMPYAFTAAPPAYGGEAATAMYQPYNFQQSCSTSSVVVSTQPFSPPTAPPAAAAAAADMHAWPPQQFGPFAGSSTGSYTMPSVVPPPFTAGFAGQYSGMCSPRLAAGGAVEPSATKEARKKRMARQRRLSCLQQQRSQQINLSQIQISGHPQEPCPRAANSAPVTPSSVGWGGIWSTPAAGQIMQNPLSNRPINNPNPSPTPAKQQKPSPQEKPKPKPKPAAAQEESSQQSPSSEKRQGGTKSTADKNLRFLLQKVLKQSDVGSLGRIVLPKKEAEIHMPELKTRDGITIPMEDIGTSQVWNMKYRFWPNNKSRMYLLENTGDFVRSNELQEGDFIVIYSDIKSGKYLIRGVKVRRAPQEQGNNSSGAVGKHKNGCPEKAGVSDTKAGEGEVDGGSVDGAAAGGGGGKPDGGACKDKSPHGVRRSRQEAAAASMNQMAVSI
uniref:TF-B3 domain-containing protein n=1 Tax=Leersia perrieri TaxID=77586 RepID=A0A0D9V9D1_9ORYZ